MIVIDNGSIQNEAVILQKSTHKFWSLRDQNLGLRGNNLGIRIAKRKCIFLINNDTFVIDDSLIYLYKKD